MISNQTVQLVFFRLYLMLYARIARFDVMVTVALFGKFFLTKGWFSSKNFHPKLSHRILQYMHRVLNIDEKN